MGDVARPDLAVDPEEGARGLFASLKRLLALGDFAEVWPGHIGGSLCGGAGMSEKPVTTIGFERRFNRLLARDDEDGFVRALTGNLAHQPPNFKRIVAMNRGPPLTEPQVLDLLAPTAVKERLEEGATLLDGRDTREFDALRSCTCTATAATSRCGATCSSDSGDGTSRWWRLTIADTA